jgi:hypothetical protein
VGPSNNTWVTTTIPFPYEQWVNGTLASQSSYTQEIHFKVDKCMLRVEHAKFCMLHLEFLKTNQLIFFTVFGAA